MVGASGFGSKPHLIILFADNLGWANVGYHRPEGVDPRKREQYLSDAEFESVFGTTRLAFGALKAWRQIELKRKVRLF